MEMTKHKCSENQRKVWARSGHGRTDSNVVLKHLTRPSEKFNWQSACVWYLFSLWVCGTCIWSWWGRNLETCTSHLAPRKHLKSLRSTRLLLAEPDVLQKLVSDPACQLMSSVRWEALARGHSFPPSVHYLPGPAGLPQSPHLFRTPQFCSVSHSHHHKLGHPRDADLWAEPGATSHSPLSVLSCTHTQQYPSFSGFGVEYHLTIAKGKLL